MSNIPLLQAITQGREKPLPLAHIVRHPAVCRGTRPVNRAQVYRWAFRGLTDRCGNRVFLEYCRLPGGMVTTEEAVLRFVHAMNGASPTPITNSVSMSTQYAEARKRLQSKGVLK